MKSDFLLLPEFGESGLKSYLILNLWDKCELIL